MLFGLLAAPSGAYANTKSDPLPIGLHGKGASVSAMTRSSEAWQSAEKSLPVMASSSGTVFMAMSYLPIHGIHWENGM